MFLIGFTEQKRELDVVLRETRENDVCFERRARWTNNTEIVPPTWNVTLDVIEKTKNVFLFNFFFF